MNLRWKSKQEANSEIPLVPTDKLLKEQVSLVFRYNSEGERTSFCKTTQSCQRTIATWKLWDHTIADRWKHLLMSFRGKQCALNFQLKQQSLRTFNIIQYNYYFFFVLQYKFITFEYANEELSEQVARFKILVYRNQPMNDFRTNPSVITLELYSR